MHLSLDLVSVLKSIPWFMELKSDQLDRLAGIAMVRSFQPGQPIFCEGDRADYLYVVLEGQVTIQCQVPTRGSIRIYTAEPLDVIGWSSLTPVIRQRNASGCAAQPSQLLCFESETLRALCEEDHDLGYIIMKRISNVVASRLLSTKLQFMDVLMHEAAQPSQPLKGIPTRP